MADNVIETGRSRIEDILLKAYEGQPLSRIEEILLTMYENLVHLDEHGLIPANLIPPVVYERMKVVSTNADRFALTKEDVQNGDVVYVNETMLMYFVVDDENLDTEAGYMQFAAGIAAKAYADEFGNRIPQTYATQSSVADAQTAASYFTFSANSGHYYLQPEQPTNPQEGDIWIH